MNEQTISSASEDAQNYILDKTDELEAAIGRLAQDKANAINLIAKTNEEILDLDTKMDEMRGIINKLHEAKDAIT